MSADSMYFGHAMHRIISCFHLFTSQHIPMSFQKKNDKGLEVHAQSNCRRSLLHIFFRIARPRRSSANVRTTKNLF